jgi:RecA-family ATPase
MDVTAKARFYPWSYEEMAALPPVEWLIEGILPAGAQAMLFGVPGEGKSFVPLSWALAIGCRDSWMGRETKPGSVVYVVAEGGRGINNRAAACVREHQFEAVDQTFFVLNAVQLANREEVTELLWALNNGNIKPSLIIFDTLSRCFAGRDENAAQEVSLMLQQIGRIQRETGGAVLLVHHTTKPKGKRAPSERGSSALRGAMDTMIRVAKAKEIVTLTCDKQKDAEEFTAIRLRLVPVSLGVTSEGTVTSCVLRGMDAEGGRGTGVRAWAGT